MLVLYGYAAVAALFYLACALEIRRARTRERHPHDHADGVILHLVALLAALLWLVSLPFLLRAAVRRIRPRPVLSRAQAWVLARLPHRRARLAG